VGGPKDTNPPKLDSLKSARPKIKNFKPKSLEFYFDEFVEVKDVLKQVLFSPPLTYIPKITAKGKRLTVKFDPKEIFKDSTTYTIHFGESIVDYHESNPLKGFKYIFSTGSVIDSMQIEGVIKDALENKLAENLIVMLYSNLSDSVVLQEKPVYSTRVNANGEFIFENIRNGKYKIVALKDQNLNQWYDLPQEEVAFTDSLAYAKYLDSSKIHLVLSKPIGKLRVSTINSKSYGKINITFDQPAQNIQAITEPLGIKLYPKLDKDSLLLYYSGLDSFKLYLPGFDTIDVKPRKPRDFYKKNPFRLLMTSASPLFRAVDTLWIEMSQPIDVVDTSKIYLEDDIGRITDYNYSLDESHRRLSIFYKWSEGIDYVITWDSVALKSIYGIVNDSMANNFKVLTKDRLGTLIAEISDLDSTQQYEIVILLGDREVGRRSVTKQTATTIRLDGLVEDRYDFRIIQDNDGDKKYSAGDYWQHIQPEKIKNIKGEKIKASRENILLLSWTKGLKTPSEPIQENNRLQSNPRSNIGPVNKKKQ
jgi:uncharacterized protein (DUF2141 family)